MDKIVESFVEIICPASGRTEKLWYRYIPNTTLFECLGCDNANGSSTCQNCIAEVTKNLRTK